MLPDPAASRAETPLARLLCRRHLAVLLHSSFLELAASRVGNGNVSVERGKTSVRPTIKNTVPRYCINEATFATVNRRCYSA
ncbi:hypothetical protein ACLOJK_006677 [Asimina triloba]